MPPEALPSHPPQAPEPPAAPAVSLRALAADALAPWPVYDDEQIVAASRVLASAG